MNMQWMPAREAADILTARGVNPVEALRLLVRETGEYGRNKLWALAGTFVASPSMDWISAPDIDVRAGTLMVRVRLGLRKLYEDRPVPLLINPYEIERRWPDRADPQRQKTTTMVRQEIAAAQYFRDVIVPRKWIAKEIALEELTAKFPEMSAKHFKEVIWKDNAPPDWKKAGPRPRANR